MKTNQIQSVKIINVLLKKVLIIIFGLLVFGNVYSQNVNCNSKLKVVNNQNSKKAGESGVSYRLKLTNTGFDATTYKIKLVNDNTVTSVQSISKNNQINISGEFYNVSLKKMKSLNRTTTYNNKNGDTNENEIEIFLNGKESKTFIVKMKTPVGAKFGSINKSEVKVTSDKCKNKTISVVLNTEIIDGE
ncbi:hypothetical protein [Lutibacter sp.]|uniref:hypothetical protein n=1 Tax=Lutibacter sp. TaxID=1925666 RepID=UPI0025C582FB|nr:hypothetical protein [Lutibacter sp.]MCF6182582.1 hypothetical protein [Lutibacter sp.]